jgi:hypothetical protein
VPNWVEAQAGAQEALSGLSGHLAIEPPPDDGSQPERAPNGSVPPGPVAGYRLRLAVAAAAHDGDQAAIAALVREGARCGVDVGELVAVAERHWPKPRLHRRAWRAGRRWTATRLRRLHRPRRQAVVAAEQERSP